MKAIIYIPHRARSDHRPISTRQWKSALLLCGNRCFYCEQVLLAGDETRDHLYPISRGGCECVGNTVVCCFPCNSLKNNRTLAEFLADRPAFQRSSQARFSNFHRYPYVEPTTNSGADPLLGAIHRLADKKRMPERVHPTPENLNHIRRELAEHERTSWAWRHPA